jgi:hypothetical protein
MRSRDIFRLASFSSFAIGGVRRVVGGYQQRGGLYDIMAHCPATIDRLLKADKDTILEIRHVNPVPVA